MIRVILAFCGLFLVGCSPSGSETTAGYLVMPEGLKDCRIYKISDGPNPLVVVRCPHSSTTAETSGKGRRTVATND